MAEYVGNNYYVKIGSYNLTPYVKSVNFEPTAETVETTRGNAEYKSRAPGLKDARLSVVVGYDTNLAAFRAAMKPGDVFVVDYGPEGNVTGKPRHTQAMICEGAPFEVNVNKDEVAFECSYIGAVAPTVDMMNGGTF